MRDNGRRPHMRSAAPVGALIEKLLEQKGMDGRLREYRSWQIWDEVVGPQIAARARPVRIREGVLEVRVEQSVWMQQLQLLKPQILARLNAQLAEGTLIRDIYLRRGRVEKQAHSAVPEPTPAPWRTVTLTAAEKARIEETLSGLQDAELKRHLRSILERQAKTEKAGRDLG